MIDINLYRCRIGSFNPSFRTPLNRTGNRIPLLLTFDCKSQSLYAGISIIGYLYFIIIMMSVTMSLILKMDNLPHSLYIPGLTNREFLHTHATNVKTMYIFLNDFLSRKIYTAL